MQECNMDKDFENFTYILQPNLDAENDDISLVLICLHNKSNKHTNIVLDASEFKKFGIGYLFSTMQDLTHILKSLIKIENPLIEDFANYLSETSSELKSSPISKAYLDDVYTTLNYELQEFYKSMSKELELKEVK